MKKFGKEAEKQLSGKVHPDFIAHQALENARFANENREAFFNDAYGAIMFDYFLEFISSEPHENRKREFIYSAVLSLGDVKSRLVQYETYAKNITHMGGNNE